jgi:AcrR family transcriptional regulator
MSSDSPETTVSARDRILAVAGRLFYRDGFRAIGIDRVIAEASVAKATFYKHFPSKDDLIVAWIEGSEAEALKSAPAMDGPQPLTDYALNMIAIAVRPSCLGCTYQVSAAEFSAPDHPAHRASLAVKGRVLEALRQRATAQGLAKPRQAAEAVFLFLEGIWAARRMFGPDAPLDNAPQAVQALIGSFGTVT